MLSRSMVVGVLCVIGGYACASGSDAAAGGAGGVGGASGFGGASGSGGGAAIASLVLESSASVALMPAAQADIVVRYLDSNGAPIAAATVSFTLIGGAQDSGLSRVMTTTDGAGHASTKVIAGAQAASFQVRVSAADAVPVVVDVAVSDRGFGNLRVTLSYSGARLVTRRRVTLFAGQTCALVDPTTSPDRQSNVNSGSEEARFIGLPAESRYAVVAVAFAMDEIVLARGCSDDATIVADTEVGATVTLRDVDLVPWGDYDLTVALNTVAVATELAEGVRTQPWSGSPMLPVTPAQLLLTALDETLRSDPLALPQLAAADELMLLRAPGTAEADLQTTLGAQMQGPVEAQAWLADQLAAELATIDLEIGVRIAQEATEPSVTWTLRRASTASSLTDTGVIEHVVTRVTESIATPTFVWSRDQMSATGSLPSIFGALTVEALDAVVDGNGGAGRTQVRELLGCGTLAAWVELQAGIASACDATCVSAACDVLLSTMLLGLHTELMTVDAARPVLSLGATFDLLDTVGDANVDALDSQMVMATWEADPSVVNATGSYMTGTANATRAGLQTP